jgi:hypothetical protein
MINIKKGFRDNYLAPFLTILLFATSVVSNAQVKQNYPQYGGTWNRLYLKDTGAFRLPTTILGVKDANAGLDTAQLRYDKADSSVKVYTGSQWRTIGSGTGGIGTDNANVGSGFRLVKPGTQEIKTLFAGFGVIRDSTTNTNGITDKIDSTTVGTKAYSLSLYDILNATKLAASDTAGKWVGNIWISGGNLYMRINGTSTNLGAVGGSGGSPGGNNTNLQFLRNGAFTGSDSLNWTASGLEWKGMLIQKNSAGTEQMRIFSDNQVNTFIGYQSGLVNNFAAGGTDNTGVGYETLISNTTGTLNTAVGKRALITVSTGSNNSVVGAGSFQKTTGSNNVGLGFHSGFENTSGQRNSFMGTLAGQNKTTGDDNVLVGYQTGGNASGAFNNVTAVGTQALIQSTGNNNTAIGYQSMYSNTTGTNNTALGYATGYGQTGSSNVLIGYLVGLNASTRSNRLMIDNANTDNPLIDGDFNADTLRINGKLYISTTDSKVPADTANYVPAWIHKTTGEVAKSTFHYQSAGGGGTPGGSNTQFQYNNSGAFGGTTMGYNNSTGAVTLTGSSNTSQFTIKANSTQSNSNPLLRLQNSSGTDLLWMHSDNAVNTFVGVSSGTANDFAGGGTDNTGYGYETLSSNTTGSLNTAIGKRAMIMNVTGAGNSAVGAGALQKTTGSNNVGIGYHSGLENTSGGKNTAIGTLALSNQTTGSENTVVGYQAAGNATGAFSNVTAVGTQSLIQSTGNNNTAVGYQTLYSNTTGTNNTAIGYAAGYGQTGSGNVTMGYLVGLNASTRSNRLMIDNANTDRPLIDGDFAADTLMINGTMYIRTTVNKVPADTSSYKPVWINTTTGELAKSTFHYQAPTPTIQQVLTAGSSFSTSHVIDAGTNDFEMFNANSIELNSDIRAQISADQNVFQAVPDSTTSSRKIVYTSNINGSLTTPNSLVTRSLMDSIYKSPLANVTDVGNVGTGVDDLMSYTIPAGRLASDGEFVEFTAVVTFAANANNKTVRVVYGSTEVYNSSAQPQNAGTMVIRGTIIRTGAATQDVDISVSTDGALFTNLSKYTATTETLSGATTLKLTGEATSNNDILQKSLRVKY